MSNFMHRLSRLQRILIIAVLMYMMVMSATTNPTVLGLVASGIYAVLFLAFVILCLKYKNRAAYEAEQRAQQAEAQRHAAEQQLAQEQKERHDRQTEWERTHGRIVTRIAGVTFDNEDGSSRQKYLKEAFVNEGSGELGFEEYEYEGKPAVRVYYEGGCIGNIPASDVEAVKSVLHRVTAPALDVERFHPDEDSSEVIYRADLTLVYEK